MDVQKQIISKLRQMGIIIPKDQRKEFSEYISILMDRYASMRIESYMDVLETFKKSDQDDE